MSEASFHDAVTGSVTGSGVIQSPTGDSADAASAVALSRSRSVRMPTHRSPSTTTTDPIAPFAIRAAAIFKVSSEPAVTTGADINSDNCMPATLTAAAIQRN